MEDLETVKAMIRNALESQKTYSPDLELCICLCAGAYMAFRIALEDVRKKKKAYVTEITRENNKRLVAHPSFRIIFDSLEVTRKQLRELGLTLQTVSSTDSDEVDDLIEEVNRVE